MYTPSKINGLASRLESESARTEPSCKSPIRLSYDDDGANVDAPSCNPRGRSSEPTSNPSTNRNVGQSVVRDNWSGRLDDEIRRRREELERVRNEHVLSVNPHDKVKTPMNRNASPGVQQLVNRVMTSGGSSGKTTNGRTPLSLRNEASSLPIRAPITPREELFHHQPGFSSSAFAISKMASEEETGTLGIVTILKDKNSRLKDENARLRGDFEQQAGLLASETQRCEEYREEVEELAASRAKLKSELAESEATSIEYKKLLQHQCEETAILNEKREAKRGREVEREHEIEGLREELQDEREEKLRLIEDLQRLEGKESDTQNMYQGIIEEKANAIAELRQECERRKMEYLNFSRRQEDVDSQNRLRELHTRYQNLDSAHQRLTQSHAEYEHELQDHKDKLHHALSELEQARQLAQYNTALDKSRSQLKQELQQQSEKLQYTLHALDEARKDAQSNSDRERSEWMAMQSRYETNISQLQAEISNLRQQEQQHQALETASFDNERVAFQSHDQDATVSHLQAELENLRGHAESQAALIVSLQGYQKHYEDEKLPLEAHIQQVEEDRSRLANNLRKMEEADAFEQTERERLRQCAESLNEALRQEREGHQQQIQRILQAQGGDGALQGYGENYNDLHNQYQKVSNLCLFLALRILKHSVSKHLLRGSRTAFHRWTALVNIHLKSEVVRLGEEIKQMEKELDDSERVSQRRHAELEAARAENGILRGQSNRLQQQKTTTTTDSNGSRATAGGSTSTAGVAPPSTSHKAVRSFVPLKFTLFVLFIAVSVMLLDGKYGFLPSGNKQFGHIDVPKITL